ncbi:hypothetical protein K505DRAFT_392196 [Melanomma pulvis-pyrius CBS 109.77]|uniref:Uncharacterized protein n=1 Tax=Melanomma pulvis-pyrius CBS 109.77 TaxID=1314802 RepID=A0A6A6WZZ2_9PLEO|nr:hypothetical protein K505DRAFT_392196 [Melanomma pulvis-pyrius CBS 109.77]
MSSPNTNRSFSHTNGHRLSILETQDLYMKIAAGQQKKGKINKNTASPTLPSPTTPTAPRQPSLGARDWRHPSEAERQAIYAEFGTQIQSYRVEYKDKKEKKKKKKRCSCPGMSKAGVKVEEQGSTLSSGGLVDRDWHQLSDAEREEIYAALASQIECCTSKRTLCTDVDLSTRTSTGTAPNGGFTHTNGRRLAGAEAQTLYDGTAAGMWRENEKPFRRIKRWWGDA